MEERLDLGKSVRNTEKLMNTAIEMLSQGLEDNRVGHSRTMECLKANGIAVVRVEDLTKAAYDLWNRIYLHRMHTSESLKTSVATGPPVTTSPKGSL